MSDAGNAPPGKAIKKSFRGEELSKVYPGPSNFLPGEGLRKTWPYKGILTLFGHTYLIHISYYKLYTSYSQVLTWVYKEKRKSGRPSTTQTAQIWVLLGPFIGVLGVFGPIKAVLRGFWGHFRGIWAYFAHFYAFRAILGVLRSILAIFLPVWLFWGGVGVISEGFGPNLAHFYAFKAIFRGFGVNYGRFGVISEGFGPKLPA